VNRVQQAAALLRAGFRLIPTDGKVANVEAGSFGKAHPTASWGAEHFADGEIGVLCGPCPALGDDWLICLDVDGDPARAPQVQAILDQLPQTLTSHGGAHLFFRVPQDSVGMLQQWADVFSTKATSGAALDLKWDGGYACEQGDWDGPVDPNRIAPLPPLVRDAIVAARGGGKAATVMDAPEDAALEAAGFNREQVFTDAAEWLVDAAPVPTEGTGGATLMVVCGALMVGFGLSRLESMDLLEGFYYPRAWPGEDIDEAGLERKLDEIERHGSQRFEPLQLARMARDTRALLALDDGGIPSADKISETPKKSGGFVRVSAADLAKPLPSVPWLCKRLALAPGRPCLIVSKSGAGKTVAIQEIAISVASGQPMFGQFPVRQGKVLHIDLDQGEAPTQIRYQQLAAGRGLNLADLPIDCVFHEFQLTKPDGSFAGATVDRDQVQLLRDESRGHALVLVDALFGVSSGMDEHRPEIGHVVQAFRHVSDSLAKEGGIAPTFVIVHHSGHGEKTRARGSISIRDRSGVMWNIDRDSGSPTARWSIDKNPVLSFDHPEDFRTVLEKKTDVCIPCGDDGEFVSGVQVLIAPEQEEGETPVGRAGHEFSWVVETLHAAVVNHPGIGHKALQGEVKGARQMIDLAISKLLLGAVECLGSKLFRYGNERAYCYFAQSAEELVMGVLQTGPAEKDVINSQTKLPAQAVTETLADLRRREIVLLDSHLNPPQWDLVSRARPGRK
jgi:hypothetical protein